MEANEAVIERIAPVISMEGRRRVRAAADRAARRAHAVPPKMVVAVWFGSALFSVIVILGVLVSAAVKHGPLGLGIIFIACVACGLPFADRWVRAARRTMPAHHHPVFAGSRRTILNRFRARG